VSERLALHVGDVGLKRLPEAFVGDKKFEYLQPRASIAIQQVLGMPV